MSYMTQNKKHKQTLESAQYGLEIKHLTDFKSNRLWKIMLFWTEKFCITTPTDANNPPRSPDMQGSKANKISSICESIECIFIAKTKQHGLQRVKFIFTLTFTKHCTCQSFKWKPRDLFSSVSVLQRCIYGLCVNQCPKYCWSMKWETKPVSKTIKEDQSSKERS